MEFDFDKFISREHTSAVKFDGRQSYFGTKDVIPAWVADMDFAVPDCVVNALTERLQHPVFGYTLYPESLYESIVEWFARRHHWRIEREWILMAPGVVPSLFAAVQAFAKAGEGVIVQPPVYFPFFSAVTTNNRNIIINPLRNINGRYEMDFEHLEMCAQQGAKLLMLCSPHNPVGRVWTEKELGQVLRISREYDLIILSDDIHCDLIYPGSHHTMLGRLAQPGDQVITTLAPNKTFNIPGLGLSALVIPDRNHRHAIKQAFETLHVGNTNPLSIVAFESAYRNGDAWLDALIKYLEGNRDFVANFLQKNIPSIKMIRPEATFLIWLDCRALEMSDSQLRDFFIQECKVGLSPGTVFGDQGKGFMRLNIGTTRASLEQILLSIAKAINK